MKKILKEFKEFAIRGNALSMAIGVIIGTAFSEIVTSIVEDLFMPLIGILTGGYDISGLSFTVGTAVVTYGAFLSAVVNFIIVAIVLFLVVKAMNKLQSLKKQPEPVKVKAYICEYCRSEVDKEATKCPHCGSEITPKEIEK